MNKRKLSEADMRTKFITPALVPPAGRWDLMTQLREEICFTQGRVIVRGKTVRRVTAKGFSETNVLSRSEGQAL